MVLMRKIMTIMRTMTIVTVTVNSMSIVTRVIMCIRVKIRYWITCLQIIHGVFGLTGMKLNEINAPLMDK